jgi:hypothetical protein
MTKEGSLGARACYNGSRAPVAQLDRASGYEPEGRVFESLRAHHKNRLWPLSVLCFLVSRWTDVEIPGKVEK